MEYTPFPRAPSHLQKKRVQVMLRGGQSLEGDIHIPEGQPLLHFLGMKRFFLNLTSVSQIAEDGEKGETQGHLSLRLTNVIWVVPLEETLHISTASPPPDSNRTVELQLVDGFTLMVTLDISHEQRMSDYLDANSGFLPFWNAGHPVGTRAIERLAVNHEAILAVREISPVERRRQPTD